MNPPPSTLIIYQQQQNPFDVRYGSRLTTPTRPFLPTISTTIHPCSIAPLAAHRPHKSMGFSHEKPLILCQLCIYTPTYVKQVCMHSHVCESSFLGSLEGKTERGRKWLREDEREGKNEIWFFPSCRRQRVFANDPVVYNISLLLFIRFTVKYFRFSIYLCGKTWKPTSPLFVSSLSHLLQWIFLYFSQLWKTWRVFVFLEYLLYMCIDHVFHRFYKCGTL